MTEIIEPSSDQVLVECSSLSPLLRSDLQAFLERQPEVWQVTRRLRVTDALVNPDTLGLVAPRFDIVVLLQKTARPEMATEIGTVVVRKIAEWRQAHEPREQSKGDSC